MNYYLMQQNNGIANIDINIQTGRIVQINEIYSFERLPVFTTENNFNELKDLLNKWISHRSISESRKDLPQILQDNHVRTPEALALKTLGLSLSDQYWFRPENTMYNWLNVNLYDNDFKQMKLLNTAESSLSASDSTLNGQLTKYWKIENDTRYLFKQSTFPFMQQAYNEVFASELLKKMKNTPNLRCDEERRTLFFERVLARKRSLEMSHTREKRKNRTYTQDYSR